MAPRIGTPSIEIDYSSSSSSTEPEHHNAMNLKGDSLGCILRKQVGRLAGQTANKRLEELHATSRMAREKKQQQQLHPPQPGEERPMLLSWDDVFVEDMLGMGSFATVCLVSCPKLRRRREVEASRDGTTMVGLEEELGNSMALDDSSVTGSMIFSYASTTTGGTGIQFDPNKYYACKSLSNKTIQQANVRGFVAAAADLVHEAFLLSHIAPHPNIIDLYGVPSIDVERAFQCETGSENDLGYFLIMEAMAGGSLSDKINEWRHMYLLKQKQIKRRQQHVSESLSESLPGSLENFLASPQEQQQSHTQAGPSSRVTASNQYQQLPMLEGRIEIALQIAMGMQHLHSHGVIFRDLKPHNVGLSMINAKKTSATATATATTTATATATPKTSKYPSSYGSSDEDDYYGSSSSQEYPSSSPQQEHQQKQQQQNQISWKLFDFGLAREVSAPIDMAPPDKLVVYGKAGSLRYMPPETMGGKWLRSNRKNSATGCFSTFSSDVYSFGIMLWELIGLQDFDRRYDTSPEDFESAVCDHGYRPDIGVVEQAILADESEQTSFATSMSSRQASAIFCRRDLKGLVEACWHEDYRQRPSFALITTKLKEMLLPPTVSEESVQQQQQQQQQQLLPRQLHRRNVAMALSPLASPAGRRGGSRSRRRLMNDSFRSNPPMKLSDLFENDYDPNNNIDADVNAQEEEFHQSDLMNESIMSLAMNDSFMTGGTRSHHTQRSIALQREPSTTTISGLFLNYEAEYNDDHFDEEAEEGDSSSMMDESFTNLNDVNSYSRSGQYNGSGENANLSGGSGSQPTWNGRALSTATRSTASSLSTFSFSGSNHSSSGSRSSSHKAWSGGNTQNTSSHSHGSNSNRSYPSAAIAC